MEWTYERQAQSMMLKYKLECFVIYEENLFDQSWKLIPIR